MSLWLHVRNRQWGANRPLRSRQEIRVDRARVTGVEVGRNGPILNIL